jgi:hypothetical protein
MSEESDANFNEAMRKALIIRVQKNQDLEPLLSWFYVQQRVSRGKAIYKRNPESLSNIVNLANLSIEESDQDMAKEILDFVIENKDLQLLIQAQTYLIKMKIDKAQDIDFAAINAELSSLLTEYEISPLAYLCN